MIINDYCDSKKKLSHPQTKSLLYSSPPPPLRVTLRPLRLCVRRRGGSGCGVMFSRRGAEYAEASLRINSSFLS
jgi:hypothetical protein